MRILFRLRNILCSCQGSAWAVPIKILKSWVPMGSGYQAENFVLGTVGYRVPARKKFLGTDEYLVPGKFSTMPTPCSCFICENGLSFMIWLKNWLVFEPWYCSTYLTLMAMDLFLSTNSTASRAPLADVLSSKYFKWAINILWKLSYIK